MLSDRINFKYEVIIPARGGSKRYPKKNVADLYGMPLISHSIMFALKTFSPSNIWVNTDDYEIAKIAFDFGVQVTMRPSVLGSDFASSAEVLFFQCEEFIKKKINCDALILLQPTNPLRPDNLIEKAIDIFECNNRNSLATFTSLNKKFGNITKENYFPKNYIPGQRVQDIDKAYFENGLLYITKVNSIMNKQIISDDVYPLILDCIESFVDIDEPMDMLFAEFLIQKKLSNEETI